MLLKTRPHPAHMGGTQEIHQFTNGYGASVIQTPFSYGGLEGLKEMIVIRFYGDAENYRICYHAPLEWANDAVGYLDTTAVQEHLDQISELPRAVCDHASD